MIANASPRDASKRLATALVQTVACTQSVPRATITHSATQFAVVPVIVPSSANAPDINSTPIKPTRRGPIRSTSMPTGMQKIALMNEAMVSPIEICARDQPNACCSGSMNGPIE